jgi:iron complex outermembrane receptor protein
VDSSSAEYFINAGGTDQKGAEAKIAYSLVSNANSKINLVRVWTGFTYNDYNFTNYMVESTDYSGKELTGVPKTIFTAGLDINTSWGIYLYTSINNTSKLPLNDANDEYAKAFTLVQAKLGWRKQISSKFNLELFAGADNLTNERYSLGNDINAFGKRYYNPSATNNYFGGLVVNF